MKSKNIALFFAAASSMTVSAATITWTSSPAPVTGTAGRILDTGLFDVSGVQSTLIAENSGGAAGTFDGISWSDGTTTNTDTTFASNFSGFHASGNLLSGSGTFESGLQTLGLTGLTNGQSYRVQVLVYDGRSALNGRTVEFDGIDQGQYANGVNNVTWGDGLLVTGTFVADSTTQDFTVQGFTPGGNPTDTQINALLVQAVPEPASSALVGIAGLGLLLRRRRM